MFSYYCYSKWNCYSIVFFLGFAVRVGVRVGVTLVVQGTLGLEYARDVRVGPGIVILRFRFRFRL